MIVFIYRDDYYNKENSPGQGPGRESSSASSETARRAR